MLFDERDRTIIEHILSYCDDIYEAVERFGNDKELFYKDKHYRNSCAMCILQIGELCGHLSDEFKKSYNKMPWREIKAMRNIVAHKYGSISIEATWETVENDIPQLKEYCKEILETISSNTTTADVR